MLIENGENKGKRLFRHDWYTRHGVFPIEMCGAFDTLERLVARAKTWIQEGRAYAIHIFDITNPKDKSQDVLLKIVH